MKTVSEKRIQAIDKVVAFWVEKSFKQAINQNNGDNSSSGGMAFLLMNMVSQQAQGSVDEGKIEKFSRKLKELLAECGDYPVTLDVDYHPCNILADAARYAEIDCGCFPCKSYTSIDNKNVARGKYQYGGQTVEL